jgi:hypothetical protein
MFRQQVQFLHLGRDPTPLDRDVNEWRTHTMLAYGLRPDFSLSLMVPVVYREIDSGTPGESENITGMDDLMLMGHWRIYQNHSGPIDTTRLSLMAGAELPTGAKGISGRSVEPVFGGVFTFIRGRQGGNVSLQYEYNTGGFENPVRGGDGKWDAIHLDGAYLFRIAPEQYSAQTRGAWYALVELNHLYELNGDNELLVAPGLMYEGRNFALELGVQLPAWQRIEHRPKTDFTVTIGFRFLF